MKIIDPVWELKNLGCETAEIELSNQDELDETQLQNAEASYDYIVVKVPVNRSDVNFVLSSMGYLS